MHNTNEFPIHRENDDAAFMCPHIIQKLVILHNIRVESSSNIYLCVPFKLNLSLFTENLRKKTSIDYT